MKRMWSSLIVIAALGLGMTGPAGASTGIDALLQQIQEAGREQQRINRDRERRFIEQRDERRELLRQARAERDQARARADRVRDEFEEGQRRINELKEQLQEASADLGRLFTSARTAAGDLRSAAGRSPVTMQYPGRIERLGRIADNPELPTLSQLEDLWFLLTQDMAATGRVARFSGEVTDVLGNRREAELIRIGEFSAFTRDGYVLLPDGGRVGQLLPRQPSGRLQRAAGRFFDAEPGERQDALVDASRGRLLEVEAEKPRLNERIAQGGLVGYTILSIGLVGLVLALAQFAYLTVVGRRVNAQLASPESPQVNNPLGRVIQAVRSGTSGHDDDPELMELQLSEAVVKETPRLERFQPLLKLFIAVAPLMGLLGTVTGMILTFQAITLFGTGDPKLMAGGISQALVTTVLGLCVALPLLFLNSLLAARSRALVQTLDEESALMLAQRLEHGRA